MSWLKHLMCLLFGCFSVAALPTAQGQDSAATATSASVGKTCYQEGVALYMQKKWDEALKKFECSVEEYPHAAKSLNIGRCHTKASHLTLARKSLLDALARQTKFPGELEPEDESAVRNFLDVIATQIVTLTMASIDPPDALILIDDRPLEPDDSLDQNPGLLVAGIASKGLGHPLTKFPAPILVDPGVHKVTLSHKGYETKHWELTLESGPGKGPVRSFGLNRLPASFDITANVAGAKIRINGTDAGTTPAVVRRPAGTYRIEVLADGYEPSALDRTVQSGQREPISAILHQTSIRKKWWFWPLVGVSAAAIGAGVAVLISYRPETPPYNGGNTGWVATP